MNIVDANQSQTDSSIVINKSWKHPTAAKQEIIQRDAAGNNSTWLACASAWNSLLSAVKLVLKWLYIGIEWPKDTKWDAFSRITVTASDYSCRADGVSLALISTLLLIPDSFCTGTKIIQDRASVHKWEQWFLFEAISVTERNCAVPVARVESELHIADRCSQTSHYIG